MISDEHLPTVIDRIAQPDFYTEGPASDGEGNIYFTSLSGGVVFKIDPDGQVSHWARSVCPNGQIILPDGDHLINDSTLGIIRRFNRDGKHIREETTSFCAGQQVYSPNDLVADPANGNIYYTDSVRDTGKVCLICPDGKQSIIASGLDYPNGIALSATGEYLYVAESYKNRILKIGLDAGGCAKGLPQVFAELPSHPSGKAMDNLPDGLALDEEGNLWVAHYGMQALQKLSPEGKRMGSLDTTIPLTSNLFFIGPRTMIVTGGFGEPGPGAVVRIQF